MSFFQVGACCSSATGCSSFEGGESEKIEWCFITKSSCSELCWSSSLPQFTEMFFDWRGWVNYPPVSIRIDRINSRIDISPEDPPRAKIDSFQCSLLKRGGRGGGLYWLVQHGGDLYMYCVWLYLGSREYKSSVLQTATRWFCLIGTVDKLFRCFVISWQLFSWHYPCYLDPVKKKTLPAKPTI